MEKIKIKQKQSNLSQAEKDRHKKSKIPPLILSADFETGRDESGLKVVKHWQIKNVFSTHNKKRVGINKIGYGIMEFLNVIDYLMMEFQNIKVYFHNLGKYDGKYILPAYLKLRPVQMESRKLAHHFSFAMTEEHNIVFIEYKNRFLINGKKKRCNVLFLDSVKIFPMSVDELGLMIGMKKLDTDYEIYDTFKNINDVRKEDWVYLERDIDIIIHYLKEFQKLIPTHIWGFTLSHTAKNYWESITKQVKSYLPKIPTNKELIVNYGNGESERLTGLEFWKDVKNWYRGGVSFVKPEHKKVVHDKTIEYDIVSMYPSHMLYSQLPYLLPLKEWDKEREQDYFILYRLELLQDTIATRMPFIPTKSLRRQHYEYGKKLKEGWYHISTPEIEIFKQSYANANFKLHPIYVFEKVSGKKIFGKYLEPLFEAKKQQDIWKENKDSQYNPALRACIKLLLNTLYGKMAQRPERLSKVLKELEPGEQVRKGRILLNDNSMKLEKEVSTTKFISPVWVGLAITSYSRNQLVTNINNNWDRFVYCDTDSMHLLDEPVKLDIGNELGQWTREQDEYNSCFRTAKQYYYEDKDGNQTFKVAGFPKKSVEKIKGLIYSEHFSKGFIVKDGKLKASWINDTMELVSTDYSLTDPDQKEYYAVDGDYLFLVGDNNE